MMDTALKTRLRVIGDMAERYLPAGFYGEVLDLVDQLPPWPAAQVLTMHDALLQNQKRYSDVARKCYLDLVNVLQGAAPAQPALARLDYLVEESRLPYPQEQVDKFEQVLQRLRDESDEPGEALKHLMKIINRLAFSMGDSPAYPSERAVKFYLQASETGVLASLPRRPLAERVLQHGCSLVEEHNALLASLPDEESVG